MKIVAFGKINESGKLHIVNRKDFDSDLLYLRNKEVVIRVEQKTKKRTISQNAYIHLLFGIFANELNKLGNTFSMQEIKDMMKFKFLMIDIINYENGEVIGHRIKDTSELTTTETAKFIDDIIHYGLTEFDVQLPLPSEQLNIMFEDELNNHKP